MNHNKYMKEWLKNHPNYYKQYKKDYYLQNKKEIDNKNKEWQTKNKKLHNKYNSYYKKKNKLKVNAQTFIYRLKRNGNLIADICGLCGADENIEFHHENYALPFFGFWLCNKCHRKIHRGV